ncbi:MAG: hypothetical protein ACK4HF_18625 [Paracoccaceae bacterium]
MAINWIIRAMRRASAFAVVCALILAPVIIAVTHGPGVMTDGAMSAEHLLHGHSHDAPEPGQSGLAHDATDHEHQTQVVLTPSSSPVFKFGELRLGMSEVSAGSLPPSGLRRPPKALSV